MEHKLLTGNIAPEGISVRMHGLPEDLWVLRGQARLFDSFEQAADALESGQLQKGCVLVVPSPLSSKAAVRYNKAFASSGLDKLMCTLTDASSAEKITAGGVLAYQNDVQHINLIREGDVLCYDADAGCIYLDIGEDGMEARLSGDGSPIVTTCLGKGTWALLTRYARMFLAEGDDKALLIDAGFPVPNLLETLRKLTGKPIELALTHGHGDHCGNAGLFGCVSIHEKDAPLFLSSMPQPGYLGEVRPLTGGQVFDLGGRSIRAIHVPGHTHGSCAFYDQAAGLLFSGDCIGTGPIIAFLEPSDIGELYSSFRRVKEECTNLQAIFSGHGTLRLKDSAGLLDDLIACADDILQGTARGIGTCVTRNQQSCKTYKSGKGAIYWQAK